MRAITNIIIPSIIDSIKMDKGRSIAPINPYIKDGINLLVLINPNIKPMMKPINKRG